MPTLAADYVTVATDRATQLCTFLFFRMHIMPKKTEQGMLIDGVTHEAFLEVKVPMNTAFALALYMSELLKDIRSNPQRKVVDFGPSAVQEEQS